MDLLRLPHFYIFLCFVLWTVVLRTVSGAPLDRRFRIALLLLSGVTLSGLAVANGVALLNVLVVFAVGSTILLSSSGQGVLYALAASLSFAYCLWRLSLYGDVPLFPTFYRAGTALFGAVVVRAYLDDLGVGRRKVWAGLGIVLATVGGAAAWSTGGEKYSFLLLSLSFISLGAHLKAVNAKPSP